MKPRDVFRTRVGSFDLLFLHKPVLVFFQESKAVGGKPQVMKGGHAEPFAARMVRVELLVAVLRRALPKRRVQ